MFYNYHPLVTVIYIGFALVMTMATLNPLPVIISFVCAYSYVSFLYDRSIHKKIWFMAIPIIIFATIIIPLFSHNGRTPIFYINDMAVTVETIVFGLVTGGMLIAVILWFYVGHVLIDTEKLLYLVGRIFPTIALLLSISLRMIPLFIRRYKEISECQTGLNRNVKNMGLFSRISFTMKKISILISWSLENSINTTTSMESRGYGKGKRTSFHLFKFRKRDFIAGAIFLGLGITIILAEIKGVYRYNFFPFIDFYGLSLGKIIISALMIIYLIIPLILDVYEEYKDVRKKRSTNTI